MRRTLSTDLNVPTQYKYIQSLRFIVIQQYSQSVLHIIIYISFLVRNRVLWHVWLNVFHFTFIFGILVAEEN